MVDAIFGTFCENRKHAENAIAKDTDYGKK